MADSGILMPAELIKNLSWSDKAIKTFVDKYDLTTKSLNQLQAPLDTLTQCITQYEVNHID